MPFIRCPNCSSRFVTKSEWQSHMFLIHDCIDAQPTAALLVKQEPLDDDEVGKTDQTESEPPTYCSLTPVDEHPSVISLDVDDIDDAIDSHFKHALSSAPQPKEKQAEPEPDPTPQEEGPRVQLFGAIESDDVDEKVHRIIYDGIVSHICKDESVTDPIAALKPPPKRVPKTPDEQEVERQRVLADVEAAVQATMGGAEASLLIKLDTSEQNPESANLTSTASMTQTKALLPEHYLVAKQHGLKLPTQFPTTRAQEWDLRRMQRIAEKGSPMSQLDDIVHSVVQKARKKSVNDLTVSFATSLIPKVKLGRPRNRPEVLPQSGLIHLSSEERRLLSRVGVVLPSHYPLTPSEQKELNSVRRVIKNRKNIQESRKRKAQYLEDLELQVTSLNHEAIMLREENESLLLRNQALLEQLRGASGNTTLEQEAETGRSSTKKRPAKRGGQVMKRTRVMLRRKVKEEQK